MSSGKGWVGSLHHKGHVYLRQLETSPICARKHAVSLENALSMSGAPCRSTLHVACGAFLEVFEGLVSEFFCETQRRGSDEALATSSHLMLQFDEFRKGR